MELEADEVTIRKRSELNLRQRQINYMYNHVFTCIINILCTRVYTCMRICTHVYTCVILLCTRVYTCMQLKSANTHAWMKKQSKNSS